MLPRYAANAPLKGLAKPCEQRLAHAVSSLLSPVSSLLPSKNNKKRPPRRSMALISAIRRAASSRHRLLTAPTNNNAPPTPSSPPLLITCMINTSSPAIDGQTISIIRIISTSWQSKPDLRPIKLICRKVSLPSLAVSLLRGWEGVIYASLTFRRLSL